MNPVIINKLPGRYPISKATILPARATTPPIIIAELLRLLLAVKPKSPAMVGIIKAPEKIVKAISSD